MRNVLTTENLDKKYGKNHVLKGLTMTVPEGCIYGFVGRNGAGKTTLMRIICGLQATTSGEYSLFGVKNSDSGIRQSRKKMGAIVESPSIYKNMTAEENLREQYMILGLPTFEGIDHILQLVGLDKIGDKKAGNFSLGMKQRLGIAVALCGNPEFLVLDEPVNGLDLQGIIEIRELILKLNKEMNITFLISSHILDELAKIATHYGFINNGRIIKEISAAELEQASRKRTRIEVSNPDSLSAVLDANHVEYKKLREQIIEVYGEININKLMIELTQYDCQVLSINIAEESLESYFMKLVGETEHA
ncbi:MAG: ATP-binding cassette domain-containing protein [Lachnospiraceae bacterium]|nr:ATP-binding cassette domain-containing protein [Lachnospiraceae bacterium]